jgi:hypothetical protein
MIFIDCFVPVDVIHAPWFTTEDSLYNSTTTWGARRGAARHGEREAVVAVDSITGRRQAQEPHLAGTTNSMAEIFLVLDCVNSLAVRGSEIWIISLR